MLVIAVVLALLVLHAFLLQKPGADFRDISQLWPLTICLGASTSSPRHARLLLHVSMH